MDMDLKPVSKPTDVTPAPPADPFKADDPFKSDPATPQTPTSYDPPKKAKKKGGKKVLLVLVVLLLMAGVAYGVYYWQQQNVDKAQTANKALTAQLAAANAKVATLEAANKKFEDDTVVPTTDEQVLASVQSYCQAAVDPTTKKALVYTAPTGTKKVLYSTDKTFASVSAVCATTADSKDAAKTYYVKLSNKVWTVVTVGTPDATATKLYNIPATTEFK